MVPAGAISMSLPIVNALAWVGGKKGEYTARMVTEQTRKSLQKNNPNGV